MPRSGTTTYVSDTGGQVVVPHAHGAGHDHEKVVAPPALLEDALARCSSAPGSCASPAAATHKHTRTHTHTHTHTNTHTHTHTHFASQCPTPRTPELHKHEPVAEPAVRLVRHGREKARPAREVDEHLVVRLRPLSHRPRQDLRRSDVRACVPRFPPPPPPTPTPHPPPPPPTPHPPRPHTGEGWVRELVAPPLTQSPTRARTHTPA